MRQGRRRLFTVILDFRGGTYIFQAEADDATEASRVWAKDFDVKEVWGMGPAAKKVLIQRMFDPSLRPTPMPEVTNVWCQTALARGHLCLIHVVETVRPRTRRARSGRAS